MYLDSIKYTLRYLRVLYLMSYVNLFILCLFHTKDTISLDKSIKIVYNYT